MPSSGGNTQTIHKSDPWVEAQPYLKDALADASQLYEKGGFKQLPYTGREVAGFGNMTDRSHEMIANMAGHKAVMPQAVNTLGRMMDPAYADESLAQAKRAALGQAIPAAVSQFAGAGMGNSTLAMDHVGRAATQAIAPMEYGAMNQAQNRALAAVGAAPGIEEGRYIGANMLGQAGLMRDAKKQQVLDAAKSRWLTRQAAPMNELGAYSQMLLGYGGQGGTQTGSQDTPTDPFAIAGGGISALALLKMAGLISDRRLKENIRRIGKTPGGHNLYTYNYKGDPTMQAGVMADEVPHAIGGYVDGYAFVDYGRI